MIGHGTRFDTIYRSVFAFGSALALVSCSSSEEAKTEPRPVDWIEIGNRSAGDEAANVFPGTVRASQQTLVGFEVAGRLASVRYDIGQAFPRGAALATIEPNDYRLRVAEARAALSESQARALQASQNLERQEALFEQDATAEMTLESARAQARSLQQISAANAARLGIARESLSDTTLTAPFAGRVARRLLEQGAQVQPGEPVLEIDGVGLEVSFTVPRAQRERLQIGDQVTVLLDRDGDILQAPGSITEISSRAAGVGAFEVLANIPSFGDELRAGMAVDVRIDNTDDDTSPSAIVIPLTAFMPTGENTGQVYKINRETGRIEPKAVRLGPASETGIIVTSGLRRGDIIVSRGLAFIEPGDVVYRIGTGAERYAK